MLNINWEKKLAEQLPELTRYAMALTRNSDIAEDLIQDCLERAWAKRALWNSQRKLRPWLFSIMHNLYINDISRLANKQSFVDIDISDTQAVSEASNGMALRDLDIALSKLSPEYREIILLAGLENLSYKEIAKITSLPLGTVMSRLSRAREKLRKMMDGVDEDSVVVQLR